MEGEVVWPSKEEMVKGIGVVSFQGSELLVKKMGALANCLVPPTSDILVGFEMGSSPANEIVVCSAEWPMTFKPPEKRWKLRLSAFIFDLGKS